MQRYVPYRKEMLDSRELRGLYAPNTRLIIAHTLGHWAAIGAAWWVAATWTEWWVVMVAIVVIGTQYYALLIIAHDGLHRRLSDSQDFNDFWCDTFVLGAIGAITRLNRTNHIRHHAHTCEEVDPDRFKYTHAGKHSSLRFGLFLTGLTSVCRVIANIFLGSTSPSARTLQETLASNRYRVRDFAIIMIWQVMLIGGLTSVFGWWGYPLMWLLPVYLFAYRADLTRVFCEHSMPDSDECADQKLRLITYSSNPIERVFFAPHNMNYHAVHHLWPGIPYVNLRRADALMRRSPLAPDVLVDRTSYVAYLWSYMKGSYRKGSFEYG